MPDNGSTTTDQTDASVETVEDQPADGADAGEDQLGDAGKQALNRMKAERNQFKRQTSELQNELEKLRKASMTESERAVAEAEAKGRSAAASEFGAELARERFDALAGRRNPDFDTAQALEYVDLSKFIGEDGKPDPKAIAAAVERLVPAPAGGLPSFDGGTRTPPPSGGDMNALLRQAAGRA